MAIPPIELGLYHSFMTLIDAKNMILEQYQIWAGGTGR